MSNSDLFSPSATRGSLATGSLKGAKATTGELAEWETEWDGMANGQPPLTAVRSTALVGVHLIVVPWCHHCHGAVPSVLQGPPGSLLFLRD